MNNERAPAFALAAAMVIGIILGYFFSPSMWFIFGGTALFFGFSVWFYFTKKQLLFTIFALLAMLLLGFLRFETKERLIPDTDIVFLESGKDYIVEGLVATLPEDAGSKWKFEMKPQRATLKGEDNWQEVTGKILVYYYGAKELDYGDRIKIETNLPSPMIARNFYAFNYREWLNRQGIFRVAYVYPEKFERLEEATGNPLYKYLIYPIRQHIQNVVRSTLKGDVAGFLEGVLLGGGKQMQRDTQEQFISVGVVHILAVSGLHVGIIALLFFLLFRTIIHLDRRWATIATFIVLLIYMMVTRMRPSVMRATIMIVIVMSGQLFGRKPKLLNSIGIAAIVLLGINPIRFFDVGFQLSFGATFGIVYLYPRLSEMLPKSWVQSEHPLSKFLVQAGLVSICAQLGTFPIITYTFHSVPLLTVFDIVLVVPSVFFAVSLGFLAVFAGIISMKLALIFSAANWLVLKFIMFVVDLFARFEYVSIAFPHFGVWFLILFYLFVIMAVNSKRSVIARRVFFSLLVLIPVGAGVYRVAIYEPELWVVFIDVGQGDGIFIKYPNGRTMLIDGGFSKNYGYSIKPFYMALGRHRIDDIFMSHGHLDHFGAQVPYYEEKTSERFIATFANRGGILYNKLLDLSLKQSESNDTLRAGDTLTGIYPAHAEILWPDTLFVRPDGTPEYGSTNNASLVMMLEYGKARFLLSGDAEHEIEEVLVERFGDSLRANVYKAGHHGSKTSNSAEFMRHIDPEAVVICVGERNRFRHPSPSTIERFDSLGTTIFRTDHDGAIWFKTNGERIWGESKLGGKFEMTL